MQRRLICFRWQSGVAACALAAGVLGVGSIGSAGGATDRTITLEEARRLALDANPGVTARTLEVAAADGAARQARAWPNPEISLEIEDFGGDLPAFSESQTTWSVNQRIELPLTRRATGEAASRELQIAALDLERAKLDLLAEVDRRFVTLLAEQLRLEVARENERTADTLLSAVSSLVNAGEVSPIEEDRAQADRARAGIEVRRAETAAARAGVELASLWGGTASSTCRAEGTLEGDPALPADADLDSLDFDAPDLARWDAEIARSEAELRMRRLSRFPDLTVTGGWRRFNGPRERTWTASAALALPLWDRNGGAVSDAAARLAQASVARQAARLQVLAERRIARNALAGSIDAVRVYRASMLPEVRRAYEAVSEGYRRGKFPLIDLLDARRLLAETELGYIGALLELQSARIDLERLLARPLDASEGDDR